MVVAGTSPTPFRSFPERDHELSPSLAGRVLQGFLHFFADELDDLYRTSSFSRGGGIDRAVDQFLSCEY